MDDAISPADVVIKTFGGITATARAIDIPISTVQGWKERRKVPQEHWIKLQDAAKAQGKKLKLTDLLGVAA